MFACLNQFSPPLFCPHPIRRFGFGWPPELSLSPVVFFVRSHFAAPVAMWAFVLPSQLHCVVVSHDFNAHRLPLHRFTCTPRRKNLTHRSTPTASQSGWSLKTSTALNYDRSAHDSAIRYIDLRTMKVVLPEDAHVTPSSPPGVGFATFNDQNIPDDVHSAVTLRHLLFTEDTVPLSDSQKDVVNALLSHRSVLYTSVSADEKYAIFLDVVMRSRLWKECVVYCASSRRAAEAVFTTLCAQFGPERRNEIMLDLGDGAPQRLDGSSCSDTNIRVVITSPPVLRSAIVNCQSGSWFENATIVFMDNMNEFTLHQWEEILISVPNRILLCMISSHLDRRHLELLPIWVETIQNPISIVSPFGSSSLLNRIELPQNLPLLRTFAYNAANHQSPVQVSLTILRDLLQKELEKADGEFIPNFAESFLNDIPMIPAENPTELLFGNAEEAMYADVASLIVADAKHISSVMRAKNKKRSRPRRKERTASSKAAARRRRKAGFAASTLFPAIVLIKGHNESQSAALSIQSALNDEVNLLWDDDSKAHVASIVDSFRERWDGQLTDTDIQIMDLLRYGIGVVHNMHTSSIRPVTEELFRGGLIPILIVDTYLGSNELCTLSSSKSVLVESGALATCDDPAKGLILASTAAALAGRVGKDDFGNLIVMWYDEAVDDESAGHEIATNLLSPGLIGAFPETRSKKARSNPPSRQEINEPPVTPDGLEALRGTENVIGSSYGSLLRSVRRFGVDGYQSIFEYSLSSFKGWLERGALHATLEKVSVEKNAIDERLKEEDWGTIAEHERNEAKLSEARRVGKAMATRLDTVLERRVLDELKSSKSGRIIGVKGAADSDNRAGDEKKVLLGGTPSGVATADDALAKENAVSEARRDEGSGGLQIVNDGSPKKGQLSAAVFVNIFDQEADGKRIPGMSSRYLAVCILADGLWTMVPVSDVQALTSVDEEVIPNADLLIMPHPATFDMDPTSLWAKCMPVDESERSAVHRISDELIVCITSEKRPQLINQQIPEFEAQRKHLLMLEKTYGSSVWFGREDELMELRRLRRRAAKVGDEMGTLEKRKEQFEEDLFSKHNDFRSIQTSLMAVLEDCHALSFIGDGSMEMTPIGALTSILPSEYPVFSSACMCLIDDIEQLTVPKFAAFVGVVVCAGRNWSLASGIESEVGGLDEISGDDEPLDLSNMRQSWQKRKNDGKNDDDEDSWDEELNDIDDQRKLRAEVEMLREHLPVEISEIVVEIRHALHQLHRRHLSECQAVERIYVPDIVPASLNTRMANAANRFADGATWKEVSGILGNEGGYAVREMRRVNSALEFIWKDERYSEFSDQVKELAGKAYEATNRWPIRDHDTILELLESGVIERSWNGNTYDKWWRAVREPLKAMGTRKDKDDNNTTIESVEAEIMESA